MTRTSYIGALTALLATVGVAALVLVTMVSAGARPAQAQDTTGTTITVNTIEDESTDDGNCSLREAIEAADTNQAVDKCEAGSATGEDSIRFSLGEEATIVLDHTLGDLGVTDGAGLVVNGGNRAHVTVSGNNEVRIFYVEQTGKLALRNLTVAHGKANYQGSGFYPYGGGLRNLGTAEVSSSTFSNNSALSHGGGINNQGTLTVSNSTISNNSADGWGGGILNYDPEHGEGILKVSDTTFSENSARYGGGIHNEGGTLEMSGTTFSKNSAGSSGGGIYSYRNTGTLNTVRLTNSTFSENSASDGAGIYISAGALEARYTTFSQNSASYSGDGFANHGTVTLSNTIIADSTPSKVNCYGSKPITDGGYNISSDASCNFTDATSRTNTDPRLDPLGLSDNGGLTKTMALQPTSPAVNAIPPSINGCGTDITTDQRGVLRPQGPKCDIGAYELAQASPPPPNKDKKKHHKKKHKKHHKKQHNNKGGGGGGISLGSSQG